MTLRLKLIKETDRARRYEMSTSERIWIPRSVIKTTVKYNNGIHELTIEDWWWEKHYNNEENDPNDPNDPLNTI